MILIVYGEDTGTTKQKFKTRDRDINLSAIRPHLFINDSPAGTVKFQVLDSAEVLITETADITIADILTQFNTENGTSDNYGHGKYRFDLNVKLSGSTEYYLNMVSTGYTFSEPNYFGWCNGFDLGPNDIDTTLHTLNTGYNAALSVEFWENKNVSKGTYT